MKVAEIRENTIEELRARKRELKEEIFHLRMQKSGGQLEKPHLLTEVRRNIARLETVISEKLRQSQTAQ